MKADCNSQIISLVRELKKGNRNAFDSLYHIYSHKIYRLARRLSLDHQESQEVLQDVFLVVWERRQFLDPEKDFKAYIYKIAKNLIIRSFRCKALYHAYEKYVLDQNNLLDNQTQELIEYHDLLELLAAEIRQLPAGRKEIFEYSRVQYLSNEEIAQKFGVSRRTVENQIYRTIKLLKERILIHSKV
ncbi:MAG: RNA polymerase sigma factor [Candidatus Cyclobacteriaceae bacterium M3_2C_046]